MASSLPATRHPAELLALFCSFYLIVFVVGIFGNVFVVLAIVLNTQLRSTTDYLISSLAAADLLILIFCLPTTLLNNVLTEWQLGSMACKVSTWLNSTTSCASIFTLVAVTVDRYCAICHTMRYSVWDARLTLRIIALLWLLSASLSAPVLFSYDQVFFKLDANITVRLCTSTRDETVQFVFVNLLLAFVVPFILICAAYSKIFLTVSTHRSLAIDAHVRDERMKLRVAQMMLLVIVVFAACWSPLYGVYCYFLLASQHDSETFQFASEVLRPIFQWLSLLSSCLNPVIYVAYSRKYRRAFRLVLILPCRKRYESVRAITRATLRLRLSATTTASNEIGISPAGISGISPMGITSVTSVNSNSMIDRCPSIRSNGFRPPPHTTTSF